MCIRDRHNRKREIPEHFSSSAELPFDIGVLGPFLRGMSPELASKVIAKFSADLLDNRNALNDAVDDRDVTKIEQVSHNLKGLSGTFGAHKIETLSRDLNDLTRADENGLDQAKANKLIDACDQAHASLPSTIKGLNLPDCSTSILVSESENV